LSGQIKITKHLGREEIVVAIHRRGEFTGDLTMLTGGVAQTAAISTEISQVIQFQDFKAFISRIGSRIK